MIFLFKIKMSSNKNNVNRIPQDELAMRAILKDMGITGDLRNGTFNLTKDHKINYLTSFILSRD